MMMKRSVTAIALICMGIVVTLGVPVSTAMTVPSSLAAYDVVPTRQTPLEKIHKDIESDYPSVRHLGAEDFLMLEHDQRIVFDVREPKEYAVSHIDGAINISPKMSAEDFLATYGDRIAGRKVVFYCSVGRRSSIMSNRLIALNPDNGDSYNLQGGIFQWHNEKRPLMVSRPEGHDLPTRNVHPYNSLWSRYISDKKAIRYKPAKQSSNRPE